MLPARKTCLFFMLPLQIGKRLEILEAGLQELAETAKPANGDRGLSAPKATHMPIPPFPTPLQQVLCPLRTLHMPEDHLCPHARAQAMQEEELWEARFHPSQCL